jgi:hypothetical protein
MFASPLGITQADEKVGNSINPCILVQSNFTPPTQATRQETIQVTLGYPPRRREPPIASFHGPPEINRIKDKIEPTHTPRSRFNFKGDTVTNMDSLSQAIMTVHPTDPQHIIDVPGTRHFMVPGSTHSTVAVPTTPGHVTGPVMLLTSKNKRSSNFGKDTANRQAFQPKHNVTESDVAHKHACGERQKQFHEGKNKPTLISSPVAATDKSGALGATKNGNTSLVGHGSTFTQNTSRSRNGLPGLHSLKKLTRVSSDSHSVGLGAPTPAAVGVAMRNVSKPHAVFKDRASLFERPHFITNTSTTKDRFKPTVDDTPPLPKRPRSERDHLPQTRMPNLAASFLAVLKALCFNSAIVVWQERLVLTQEQELLDNGRNQREHEHHQLTRPPFPKPWK